MARAGGLGPRTDRVVGAAGLTFFFLAVPATFGPLLGALVDRVRRKPLLVAANMCGAALSLALLGVHGRGQVWLIYLVMFGFGVIGSMQSAAQPGSTGEVGLVRVP